MYKGEIISVLEFVSEYFLGIRVHYRFKRLETLNQITVCMTLKPSSKYSLSIIFIFFFALFTWHEKESEAYLDNPRKYSTIFDDWSIYYLLNCYELIVRTDETYARCLDFLAFEDFQDKILKILLTEVVNI